MVVVVVGSLNFDLANAPLIFFWRGRSGAQRGQSNGSESSWALWVFKKESKNCERWHCSTASKLSSAVQHSSLCNQIIDCQRAWEREGERENKLSSVVLVVQECRTHTHCWRPCIMTSLNLSLKNVLCSLFGCCCCCCCFFCALERVQAALNTEAAPVELMGTHWQFVMSRHFLLFTELSSLLSAQLSSRSGWFSQQQQQKET